MVDCQEQNGFSTKGPFAIYFFSAGITNGFLYVSIILVMLRSSSLNNGSQTVGVVNKTVKHNEFLVIAI